MHVSELPSNVSIEALFFSSCLAFGSGSLEALLSNIAGVTNGVEELLELIGTLSAVGQSLDLREVGKVLHGQLTVDQVAVLAHLLDLVGFGELVVNGIPM